MRYAVNDVDLGSFVKIDMNNKKEMYLFIHIECGFFFFFIQKNELYNHLY